MNSETSQAIASVLLKFGFSQDTIGSEFELHERQIIRMGMPPLRIELLTTPSGVEFVDCFGRRESVVLDEIEVTYIGLDDLKRNKAAAGRPKDLADLDNLP